MGKPGVPQSMGLQRVGHDLETEKQADQLQFRSYHRTDTVVQSLSYVQLFANPWTATHQASLSFNTFRSLLKLTSIDLVITSNHLILCCPFLLLPSLFPYTTLFRSYHVRLFATPWTADCQASLSFTIS